MELIILDRDGVINEDSDEYIKSPNEWVPIPGSLDAIAQLNQRGYKVAIATNQSGIGRGYYDLETLSLIHLKMNEQLSRHQGKIDYISFCPHLPHENCFCRKPKPGMLIHICEIFAIQPKAAMFIGDNISDMQAAQSIEMPFTLVQTGKGNQLIAAGLIDEKHTPSYKNLSTYVNYRLGCEPK